MKNIAILGASWGDEAKSRITNDFSPNYDLIVRFAGGDNVGGQVYRNGKSYVHHLLPVIDYNKSKAKGYLGSGMVINMTSLLEEIKTMQQDFQDVGKRTLVDIDAFVVLPEYIERDKVEGKQQGTTFRGIRQAYTAKAAREGTRVYNLINDNAPIIQALQNEGVQFTTALQMRKTFEHSSLLFEGNQGIMLGLETGRYPYITSSDTGVSGIYSSGFHWVKLDRVYGIAKGGYTTRSGGINLPTEMSNEEASFFVERGGERGNTTGRARGIGHMDLVALRYAVERGGLTHLILTKLDIMNGLKSFKICVKYGDKERIYSPSELETVNPQYTEMNSWQDARDIKQIKPFLSFVEEKVGVPIEYVSVGVNENDLLKIETQENTTREERMEQYLISKNKWTIECGEGGAGGTI